MGRRNGRNRNRRRRHFHRLHAASTTRRRGRGSSRCPRRRDDPSEAIEHGIADLLWRMRIDPARGRAIVGHGTTVATNMVIERRGAPPGLITTEAFATCWRSAARRGRTSTTTACDKPPPLVPRERRARGRPSASMPDGDGAAAARRGRGRARPCWTSLAEQGVEAVAICFLHAYRNAAHERRAERSCAADCPTRIVSVSSRRAAGVPRVRAAVDDRRQCLRRPAHGDAISTASAGACARLGHRRRAYTIHSNGGLMSVDDGRATVRCAPACRVRRPASWAPPRSARAAGFAEPRSHSTSAAPAPTYRSSSDGKPLFTSSRMVAGYPVKTPMIDIHVIGAGGGTIAWIDDAGALKVGPRSAGAVPGPRRVRHAAAPSRRSPTPISAWAGWIPSALLGGRMRSILRPRAARSPTRIAEPLGLSMEEAAQGILQIANANMSRAIRSVSIEKRLRHRGLRAVRLRRRGAASRSRGGRRVRHPAACSCRGSPGPLCARGMLLTDLSFDYVRSHFCRCRRRKLARDPRHYSRPWSGRATPGSTARRYRLRRTRLQRRMLDARYRGQNFEVKVDCDGLGAGDFEQRRRSASMPRMSSEYGYAIQTSPIEFVICRRAGGRRGRQRRRRPMSQAASPLRPRASASSARSISTARRGWQ